MLPITSEEPTEQTTLESLEKRIAEIEKCVTQLLQPTSQPLQWKDWCLAVGKYRATELSEEVDAAGREIREADRRESAS
jgi:hypothetical protein